MTPVVIDTDPGIDDALALLLAWNSRELGIEAITTVAGNVPVEQATINLLRVLELRRPRPLPVIAAGAAAPLARPLVTAQGFHGHDGMGDLAGWPDVTVPVRPGGVDVLVDAARRHGPRLTVIALGPLTNVALALRAKEDVLRTVGRLVIMGGAVDVPGNVTPAAEFNAHVDPDALREVFSAGLTIDLVSLDATRQALLMAADLDAALERAPDGLASRVRSIAAVGMQKELVGGETGMVMHDPLAVAVAVDPGLVEGEGLRLRIGPEGETRRAPGTPTCRMARKVDRARFRSFLVQRLGAAPS